MTSNAGARALLDSKPLGFATGEKQVNDGRKSAVLAEVKRIFRPEFLNRIDEILVFDPLGEAELRQIVEDVYKRQLLLSKCMNVLLNCVTQNASCRNSLMVSVSRSAVDQAVN